MIHTANKQTHKVYFQPFRSHYTENSRKKNNINTKVKLKLIKELYFSFSNKTQTETVAAEFGVSQMGRKKKKMMKNPFAFHLIQFKIK